MHWFRQLAEMYSERDIPLYHAEVYADIRVKLSAQGEYLGAEAARRKVVIPITEQSASRTSAVQPHPLCDILGYLAGDISHYAGDRPRCVQGNEKYMAYLEDWAYSEHGTSKLRTLCGYLEKRTLMADMLASGVLNGMSLSQAEKAVVCFVVDGVDLCACKETQSSHIRYTQMLGDNTGVCCLTGEHVATARLHPKRITGAASSAKLITADALPIGSEMSFKAHAVLKRIIAEDGSRFGTRTLVAWDEHGAPFSFGIEEKESPCSRVTVLVLNEVSRGNIGISYIGQTERRRLSAAYPEILARQRESGLEPVEQLLGRLLESTDIQEQIWN